jgi:hypothetical protein
MPKQDSNKKRPETPEDREARLAKVRQRRREYDIEYRKKNKQLISDKKKIYVEINRERIKAYQTGYSKKNRNRMNYQTRLYRQIKKEL